MNNKLHFSQDNAQIEDSQESYIGDHFQKCQFMPVSESNISVEWVPYSVQNNIDEHDFEC